MLINSMIGEMSGSMGGITASHNAGGSYFRKRVIPVNAQTPKQTAVREAFSFLSKAFGTLLSAAQQLAWKTFSTSHPMPNRLGFAKVLSGIAMYKKLNGILTQAGFDVITDPPVDLDVSSSVSMEITAAVAAGNAIELTYAPVLGATEALYVSGVVNISPGINNANSLRKFVGVSGLAEASPFTMTLPAEFGNLTEGKKISLKVRRVSSTKGALSPGVVVEAISA